MTGWLQTAIERGSGVDDWLLPRRRHSLQQLRTRSWPTRKTEDWRYLPIDNWQRVQLEDAAGAAETGSGTASADNAPIEGLDSIDLVFVDGVFQRDCLSQTLPAGIRISALQENGSQMPWALDRFASIKPQRHLFGLVNDVLAENGVIVDVDPGAVIARPLRIVHETGAAIEAHTRILVRVGSSARLVVVEQFKGDQLSRSTAFSEYEIAADATLEHYRLGLQSGASMSIGGCHFELHERAKLVSNLVAFGSQLSRLDVDVQHSGSGAEADFNAIYLLDGRELFDLHSNIEHAVPGCTSNEVVRGIVAANSRAVFNGRIHIHRDAQKSHAELNNRNLLMSDRAEVNTKPELEIYADDVRCAHGATVAEIDQAAIYYLQSRGLTREQAQIMLSFGFINELVEAMPSSAVADWLRPQLRSRFAAMEINRG